MTTATTEAITWPSPEAMQHALKAVNEALDALDAAVATWDMSRVAREPELLDPRDAQPSFEYLGQLSAFIAQADEDLRFMREHVIGRLRSVRDDVAARMDWRDA